MSRFWNLLNTGNVDKYAGDHMLWGWFAPYPFLISIGAIICIAFCALNFWRKRMPMADLQVTIVISLPIGLVCASIFGKLGTTQQFNWKIYEYLFIWNPGMNLFGGLVGGASAGFAYLWKKHNQRLISMWVYADAIIPNILIAQSIGRWGNLFNHEILGKPVSVDKINWLPNWIWERCYYIYDPSTGTKMTEVIYREPLFLYESLATFILFLLFIFVFPNLGKWFSKKPWQYEPKAYPNKYNSEYKWMDEKKVEFFPLQAPIKYQYNKNGEVRLSLSNVWNKAYYLKDVDSTKSRAAQEKITNWKSKWEKYLDNKKMIQKKYKANVAKSKINFKNNPIKLKQSLVELKSTYKLDVKNLEKPSKNSFVHWWKTNSTDLYNLHNDKNYFIVHSGFLASLYLITYSIVRVVLESRRSIYELSIKGTWVLDMLMYAAIIIFGVVLFVFAQFIAPKKWREEGWLYEKSY